MFKHLKEDIDSFLARDPAAKSRLEIVLCYPGFHALLFYKLSSLLWKINLRLIARFVSQFGRFVTGIEIHPGATIGRRFFIDHGMGVVIGETSVIGDDVTMYHGVTLGGVAPDAVEKGAARHPQIGNHVIIGSGAQLLGPIVVGEGARIGSNAVVVKNVDASATMVGIPARQVIRYEKKDASPSFDAYGTSGDGSQDPRQIAIDNLIREVQLLNRRIKDLESQNESIEVTAEKWESKKS